MTDVGSRSGLRRGAVGAVVVRVAGVAATFGLQALLGRLLGPSGYGEYLYAFSWATLLAMFLKLGLDNTTLRFGAQYLAAGDWGRFRGLTLLSTRVTVQLASVATLAMAGAGFVLLRSRGATAQASFALASLLLVPFTIEALQSARLRVYGRVVAARVPREVLFPVLIASVMLATWRVAPGGATSVGAAAAAAAAAVVMALTLVALQVRARPAAVGLAVPAYESAEWLRTGLQLAVLAGLNFVINEVDVLMVGTLLGSREAGLYGAASRITKVIPFGLAAINFVAAPTIARLHAKGDHAELQRFLGRAAVGILITALPAVVGLALWGDLVLRAFGPAFAEARVTLLILVAGQAVNAACGSIGLLLIMTGHQRENLRVVGLCAAGDLVLALVLVPRYGMVGGAIATSLALASWNIVLSVVAWRLLRLDPTVLSVFRRRPRA